ncbi:hypothetical protein P152DRAFT_485875 [Eremomyces bilateralis CBS 781.70]|uniref:Rhodopsin domain-containing protein n=1 Tax=Eremomyces bilateralis CBS 781.70 TaxID=1392243 RepID=A0A6G1FQ85_9PEZI|nr:uncharacterized protein P152DRAFT_485875 [Eremomyces bilateralis CBS 781.70]KAF1807906.1 hypothetical protein P152DRAFT_485875 [Eremomyces bilateralis CBS 781.70]
MSLLLGVTADQVDPALFNESITPKAIGSVTSFFAVSLVVYIARIYARWHAYKSLWWDDFAMTVAMLLSIAGWGILIQTYVVNEGKHYYFLTMEQLKGSLKWGFITMPLWVWTVAMIKVSILLMLARVKQSKAWTRGMWGLIVFVVSVAIALTVVQVIQCLPVKANWEIMMPRTLCWDPKLVLKVNYGLTSLFISTDFACALLPIAFVRKIHRPFREKVVICVLMALGLLASACGLVRLTLLKSILTSGDAIYDGANLSIWAYAELYVGMVAACIPCLKAMMEKAFHALGGHLTNAGSKDNTYTQQSRGTDVYDGRDYNLRPMHNSQAQNGKSADMSVSDDDIPLARRSNSGHPSYSGESMPTEPPGIRKAVEFSWAESRV